MVTHTRTAPRAISVNALVRRAVVFLLACLSTATSVTAQSIPIQGIASTGVGVAGGAPDVNWTVVETGQPAVVVASPVGAWLPNSETSKWIWQQADALPVNVVRTFRARFTLSATEAPQAKILGIFAADNYCDVIRLNGVPLGPSTASFSAWTGFGAMSGFVVGENTLDFVVRDVGGVAGLRVELRAIIGFDDALITDAVSREVALFLDPAGGGGSGGIGESGTNAVVTDAVSREVALFLDASGANGPSGTNAVVGDAVSRESQMYMDRTDANNNGIADVLEPGLVTDEFFATVVTATGTAWRDASEATGSTGSCTEQCDCNDTNGQYAYNGSPGAPGSSGYFPGDQSYLVADFGTIAIPAGRVVSAVFVDVMCRYNGGTSGAVRAEALVGGSTIYSKDVEFASNTACDYRIGGGGRVTTAPSGGWTAANLSNLKVQVKRVAGNNTSLRVKAFKVTVNFVEVDTDRDGISDSFDNCPQVANPLQEDCNDPDNGVGDACEVIDYPQRDANRNGVTDACEGVAGWIGSATGSFSSAANWSSGSVPGAGTKVFLGASTQGGSITVSTAGPVNVESLIVTRGTVRLNLGGTFRVANEFTVAPGAALIVDGAGAILRDLEIAGVGRVAGGAKLEVGANARVRALAGGSFRTDALSTLAVVLRNGLAVPVAMEGAAVFNGGFSAKLGALGEADLPLGRSFTVISSTVPVESFYSALTAQGLGKKFLKVLGQAQFGLGSLVLEVGDLQEFIRAAGGSDTTLASGALPTAIVARNFDTPPLPGQPLDLFDDIAITVKKTNGVGQAIAGDLYIFKSNGAGGSSAQQVYPTGIEPVAVESSDLDGDGSFDLAVLTRVSGLIELYLNPNRDVTAFVVGATASVGVGARYFGVDDITPAAFNTQFASLDAFLIANPASNTLRALIVSNGSPVLPPSNPVTVPTSPGPLSPIGPGGTSRDEGAFLTTRSAPADSEYGAVTRYVVVPDGSLIAGGSVEGPGQPTGIAIEQLNADALVDMVVTGLTPEEFGSTPGVFVYPGVGVSTSGFATGGQLPLEQRPLDVAIGDFTGDGKDDFAVAMGAVTGGVEFGTVVRRFNNATASLENPVFESGPDDLLFDGQGVRRLRAAELNALPPTDYAVLGETVTGGGTGGNSSFAGGGSQGFAGGRLFAPTQAPPCVGDTNGDGVVNGNDLAALLVNWGSTGTADLDGSGSIDANDLAIMLVAWGACP